MCSGQGTPDLSDPLSFHNHMICLQCHCTNERYSPAIKLVNGNPPHKNFNVLELEPVTSVSREQDI